MKIVAGLILKRKIQTEEDAKKYASDVATYINHVDKLIVFNMSGFDQNIFFNLLKKYDNIEIAECEDFGEVMNFQLVLYNCQKLEADFGVVLYTDYFYAEDAFLTMKRTLIEWKGNLPSVLTPLPLYTCELEKRQAEKMRDVKGAHLLGTFIYMKNYLESVGFVEEYYQTMFDYDYCISERLKGHRVVLMNNCFLRNRNYRVIEKRYFGLKVSSYEKSPYELYYETRNRLYLWDKYKSLDPEYVALDQKQASNELRDMKVSDRLFREKREIIAEAKRDYAKGIMGNMLKKI